MKPFTGTLVALGNAEHIDIAEWGDRPALLFLTDVEGCRSAAGLLRKQVQLAPVESASLTLEQLRTIQVALMAATSPLPEDREVGGVPVHARHERVLAAQRLVVELIKKAGG